MSTGRACGDNAEVGSLETVLYRQVPGDHVNDVTGHVERRNSPRATALDAPCPFFYTRDAAYPRSDSHADPVRVNAININSRILYCLDTSHHAVVYEGAHFFLFFSGDIGIQFKIFYRAGDPDGITARIKVADCGYTAVPRQKALPGFLDTVSQRSHQAQPGNDDSTFVHCSERLSDVRKKAALVQL